MSVFDPSVIQALGLPTECPPFFPPLIEKFRRTLSAAAATPDEYGLAYLLTAGATALGANVTACVQPGWCTRGNVFMAIVGYKGRGKSILGDKVFAPLRAHEQILQAQAEMDADMEMDSDDGDDLDDSGEETRRRSKAKRMLPALITNDTTMPALLALLGVSERGLLANLDELSTSLQRNGGGERQTICELYDGRARSRHRASDRGESAVLEAPYLSILGTIQPGLLELAYNKRGDDGMFDRFLMVGMTGLPPVDWPEDAHDPALNEAWSRFIDRLLRIETLAVDANDGKVDVAFRPEAIAVLRDFTRDVNRLVLTLGLPESQYGVTSKIRGHAVRLALLHRAFRWAAGEFGASGPLGNIDEADALAARDAAAFFLGRWMAWRPELRNGQSTTGTPTVGLSGDPGEDPVLRDLADTLAVAQSGASVIDRLVRYLRHNSGAANLAELSAVGPLAAISPADLKEAAAWLVEQGHASWADDGRAICLAPLASQKPTKHRVSRQTSTAR
jgi:hypothetical protein